MNNHHFLIPLILLINGDTIIRILQRKEAQVEIAITKTTIAPIYSYVSISIITIQHKGMGRSLVVSLLIGCTGIQNRMPGAQFPVNNLFPGCIIIVIGLGIILIAIILGKIAEMLSCQPQHLAKMRHCHQENNSYQPHNRNETSTWLRRQPVPNSSYHPNKQATSPSTYTLPYSA